MSINYSVAMAAYNGEKFIENQLMSILRQKEPPKEIIIVDDSSTDDTSEIIEEIKKKTNIDINIIYHEQNQGYRKSFFEAIKMTSYPVVFLSDQDDIWKNTKSQEILSVIKNNDKILAVNTDYDLIDGRGNKIHETILIRRKSYHNDGNLKKISSKEIINYNLAMGCTMAITEPLINIIKKNERFLSELLLPHDWAINFIAAKFGGLFYLERKLMNYRLHGDNTIGLERSNSIKFRIDAYENVRMQKMDMEKINAKLFDDDIKTKNYIMDLDECYQFMIDALNAKSVLKYLKLIKNKNKHFSYKTLLYDIFLIYSSKVKRKELK